MRIFWPRPILAPGRVNKARPAVLVCPIEDSKTANEKSDEQHPLFGMRRVRTDNSEQQSAEMRRAATLPLSKMHGGTDDGEIADTTPLSGTGRAVLAKRPDAAGE